MTPAEIDRLKTILKQYELLTYFGFGEFNQPDIATHQGRARLMEATAEIDLARRWLQTQTRRKTVNRNRASYGLKHYAERALGAYVANGAFIAAALLDGWIVRRCSEISPNAWLNIGETGLRRACGTPTGAIANSTDSSQQPNWQERNHNRP